MIESWEKRRREKGMAQKIRKRKSVLPQVSIGGKIDELLIRWLFYESLKYDKSTRYHTV